jgi:hypothetical protein
MQVAFGLKAHSGWAVLVTVGLHRGEFYIVDRQRIELIEDKDTHWAKQPYHAAQGLEVSAARGMVTHGIAAAHSSAMREVQAAVYRSCALGYDIMACAVLVPNPMPNWSTDEILAVHFRMHKAEGMLFADALVQSAKACELNVITIPEKQLGQYGEKLLARPLNNLMKKIEMLGKSVGAPWGKDQKSAALAAMIGLY